MKKKTEHLDREKKRILILYADAGFGHRSAANAIAEAIQIQHGQDCEVFLHNPLDDKQAPRLLRESQSDYDKIVRSAPELYKIGYEASDSGVTITLFESALILMLYEVMRDVIRHYRPDVILSTYPLYAAPLDAAMTIGRQSIPILTTVTDLVTVHRIWFYTGMDQCLVPTPEVAELAYQAGLSESQVKVTGLPVSPVFTTDKRTRSEIRAELGWDPDLLTVLAAGSKRVERLDEMMNVFNHSAYPLQLVVVAGGHDELYELLRATRWHKPVHLYNFVENMPTMLMASDMLLGKAGGLIVSEALAAGVPMFLTNVLPGQEEGNAAYVIQNGAAALTESPISLLENLFHWMDNDAELLKKHKENAARLGKPQASLEIAEIAWEAARSSPLERKGLHILERTKLMKMMRNATKPNES